ncbi:MarR family winged helix-turn-helix transcriptional regulator [Pseudochryseolinea flava]|uniref:MarR family transcriptional regulator n=1 Tax=Pseudochryseolinea flava TaxID=2059302 RepID=A0A364Y444_9BACT|nr:MarR family winged helix-turn-helix transcriptional regulator [Pseudochryseolinea flava]RAW00585.1 MarR family transcriptional regulator [Pseudochryseolinea flava]
MKKSSFNLDEQNENIDSRIVVAMERISQAFRVLLWNESKEYSLSPIQIQILIFLLFHSKEKAKVSYLANEFNMTKATISDSIKILLEKKLISKTDDPNDTRSYSVTLTAAGKKIAEKSSNFSSAIEKPLGTMSENEKHITLKVLLTLIEHLNKSGIITVQRMCATCSLYSNENGIHYCKLLRARLLESELRLDCPEHVALK